MDLGHNAISFRHSGTGMTDLGIDLSLLEAAMEMSSSSEGRHVLDVETGDVILVTDEVQRALEETRELPVTLDAALAEMDLPDWMNDAVREADAVDRHFGTRFIEIPGVESRDAYNDMAEFIETIADEHLRERFRAAIVGRGAFRRFKDTLLDAPSERTRWYEFENHRNRVQAVAWLRSVGIEPREPDTP